MVQNDTEKSPKCYSVFYCKYCNYQCSKKSDFNKHKLTQKHKKNENMTENTKEERKTRQKVNEEYSCECGKIYKYKQGLYRHQKICKIINEENEDFTNETIQNLVNENSEIKSMLFKQFEALKEQQEAVQSENKKLRNQISELIPKVGNTVNNTINSKQKFNINIFLNETCKDALTINEFIDKIKISLNDLMITKTKGLSEGVSNIFIENMNKLSLHERPMHCTDMKKETLYIKCDNFKEEGWAKDYENKNLKEAISKVTHAQRQSIDKWVAEHPDWEKNISEQEEYHGAVGRSTQMRSLFSRINKVAATPATVLIQGETGTGKEVVACSIFESSNRKEKPFVVLDCSSIPKNLVESELFGHEKGSFTGASQANKGIFNGHIQKTVKLGKGLI